MCPLYEVAEGYRRYAKRSQRVCLIVEIEGLRRARHHARTRYVGQNQRAVQGDARFPLQPQQSVGESRELGRGIDDGGVGRHRVRPAMDTFVPVDELARKSRSQFHVAVHATRLTWDTVFDSVATGRIVCTT